MMVSCSFLLLLLALVRLRLFILLRFCFGFLALTGLGFCLSCFFLSLFALSRLALALGLLFFVIILFWSFDGPSECILCRSEINSSKTLHISKCPGTRCQVMQRCVDFGALNVDGNKILLLFPGIGLLVGSVWLVS